MEHIIKYYPIGNADCTLIKLDNGKTIIGFIRHFE